MTDAKLVQGKVALVTGGGAGIPKQAEAAGAATFYAANAVWAIAVSAGSLPSILWCLARLSRDRAWPIFARQRGRNAALCVLMAVIWISGTVLYGAAARMMGPLGPAVGWPIYMSGMIPTGAACYRDTFDDHKRRLDNYLRLALDEGLFLLPDGRVYVSAVHTESEVAETLEAIGRVFRKLA
jgi:hypothetical protein